MSAPFILPPLLLVAVLIISAAFKLRDPSSTADAFASLRLPHWMRAGNAHSLLPYGELALALSLVVVPAPAYLVVTVLALLLFVAYLAVIVRALSFDEPVTCGCFGHLGLGDIDRRTVVRNMLLVLLGGAAVADAAAGESVIHRFGSFGSVSWTWLLGVAAAIVLTVLIVVPSEVPTDHASSGSAGDEEGLDYKREPIPYGALRDRETAEATPLSDVGAGRPALLVFLSLSCGACVRTMEALPEWAKHHTLLRTIAVSAVGKSVNLPDLGPHVTWMDDPSAAVARTFGVSYPAAVLLGIDGLLAGGPETGSDRISDFLDAISQQLVEAGVDPAGQLAASSSERGSLPGRPVPE